MLGVVLATLILLLSSLAYLKGLKFGSYVNYVLILSIPITSLEGLRFLNDIRIGPMSITQILMTELIFLSLFSWRTFYFKRSITSIGIITLLFIFGAYLVFFGINRNALSDAADYVLPIIYAGCFARTMQKKSNNIELFLKLTILGTMINGIILIAIYWMHWLPVGLPGRYSMGSMSLYLVSIPAEIGFLITETRHTKVYPLVAASACVQIYLIFVSQTRSLIICLIVIAVLTLLLDGKFYKRFSIRIAIIASFGIFGAVYLFLGQAFTEQNGWIARMAEVFSSGFRTDSNIERTALLQHYIPVIRSNPIGVGFGKYMVAVKYTPLAHVVTVSTDSQNVDNVFLTMSYKVGVFACILYLGIIVSSLHKLIQIRKENLSKMMKVALIVTMIPISIMSVQILKNSAIATYMWMLVYSANSEFFNHKGRLSND